MRCTNVCSPVVCSFYHTLIDEVISCIKDQISYARKQSLDVKVCNIYACRFINSHSQTLILVGEYSEIEYIKREVAIELRREKLVVYLPKSSWTATTLGAVVYGMEMPSHDQKRPVREQNYIRHNYGIFVGGHSSQLLASSSRLELQRIFLDDENNGDVHWFIKKDDYAYDDYPTTHSLPLKLHFQETCPRKGLLKILSCSDNLSKPRTLDSGLHCDRPL
jgi:hypothetical protein